MEMNYNEGVKFAALVEAAATEVVKKRLLICKCGLRVYVLDTRINQELSQVKSDPSWTPVRETLTSPLARPVDANLAARGSVSRAQAADAR